MSKDVPSVVTVDRSSPLRSLAVRFGGRRTWSPEDNEQLVADLEERVFDRLPDDTWFYPGHGDDSTLGAERPRIPEWRSRGW